MEGVLIPHVVSTSLALAKATAWPMDGGSQRLVLGEQTVGGLRDEVVRLRQENAELRREKAELRQPAGYWKALHTRVVEREAKLAKELEAARGEIRKLQESASSSPRDATRRVVRFGSLTGQPAGLGLPTGRRVGTFPRREIGPSAA
jgi:hypothetical protein